MEIRILGPVEIHHIGAVIRPRRRQERLLLSVLALEHRRFVSMDRLVDLFWPTEPPMSARSAVQAMVSHLRSALARSAGTIVSRENTYALIGPPDLVDVWRFWTLLAEADHDSAPIRVARLRAALDLWRGPALADAVDPDSGMRAAEHLTEERLTARERLWEALLDTGGWAAVVSESAPAADLEPLRERLIRIRMLALYRAGQSAAALDVYATLAARLDQELGVLPSGPTRHLHLAILRDDPGLQRVGGQPVPAQLPAPPGQFVGRDEELAWLAQPRPRGLMVISAIAGTAGVGKTALVLHWAHHARDQYPDGQLYLDLRGFSRDAAMSPVDALTALLRGLDVAVGEMAGDAEALAARYRTEAARRRMLIFLDNAADAAQVRPLLPGGDGCRVIVTSRHGLSGLVAAEGAYRLVLGLLDPGQAVALLAAIVGPARVCAQPAVSAELVRVCGYLPLAIRIAAANLLAEPGRPLADYLAALRAAPLAMLAVTDEPGRAVIAALDLSYQRLPPTAQRMFRLLGVVPGPHIDIAAANALAATERAGTWTVETRRIMTTLVEANLVREVAPDRFTMHDLVREYAVELIDGDPDQVHPDVAARLYHWYLAGLDAVARMVYPSMARLPVPAFATAMSRPEFQTEEAAIAWAVAELPNLVAAVAAAARRGPTDYAWRLADAIRGFYWNAPPVEGWRDIAGIVLDLGRATGHPLAEAIGEMTFAAFSWSTGATDTAVAHLRRALPLIESAGWRQGQASVLGNLGLLYSELGQLDQAIQMQKAALAIDRELGLAEEVAARLGDLGAAVEDQLRIDEAGDYYEQSLHCYQDCASATGLAIATLRLARARVHQGRLDEVSELARASRDLHQRVGDRQYVVYSCLVLGHAMLGRGDTAAARTVVASAQPLADQIEDQRLQADVTALIGEIDLAEGHVAAAVTAFREAVGIADRAERFRLRIHLRCLLTHALCAAGDRVGARRAATDAAQLANAEPWRTSDGPPPMILISVDAEVSIARARVALAYGDTAAAAELVDGALAEYAAIGLHPGLEKARALHADIAAAFCDARE